MIFDTHAHYDDEAFDEDRDEVLTSLRKRGVGTVVNVGASMEGSRRSVSLSEEYEFVYSAVGCLLYTSYIRLGSGEFLEGLYHNMTGVLVMSVCLGIYGAAYLMGKRMVQFEI